MPPSLTLELVVHGIEAALLRLEQFDDLVDTCQLRVPRFEQVQFSQGVAKALVAMPALNCFRVGMNPSCTCTGRAWGDSPTSTQNGSACRTLALKPRGSYGPGFVSVREQRLSAHRSRSRQFGTARASGPWQRGSPQGRSHGRLPMPGAGALRTVGSVFTQRGVFILAGRYGISEHLG